MTPRCRFFSVDDLMSCRCFSKNCDTLCFFFFPHIPPTYKRVTCNTLLLETDVDFITSVCGFFHNVDTMSYAWGYQDTFAWHTHLSSAIQHATVTQHTSETQVMFHYMTSRRWKWREGSRRGKQMHKLSKSHPNPYLFTDLFNKEKKNANKWICLWL